MSRSTRRIRSIDVSTVLPGWLMVPDDVDAARAEGWPARVAEQLKELWGEQGQEHASADVERMLEGSLDVRDDDDFVFEVWPFTGPIRARVRVRIVAGIDLPDWREIGYDIMPYESQTMGQGYIATDSADVQVDDEQVTMFRSAVVFDDGELTVVISVEPAPQFMYMKTLVGLQGLADSLAIAFSDGSTFRAVSPTAFVHDPEAEWPGDDGSDR